MPNRILKAAALASALAITMALSACGGGTSAAVSSSGPDKSMIGQLTVWDYYTSSAPGWQPVMDAANAQFEKNHPGVKITYVAQPGDNAAYTQLVSSSFVSKKGPDVMMLQPGWDGVLQFAKGLAPLDGFYNESFKSQISGFTDSSMGGKTFGIPLGGGAIVLAYNKTLLSKAGITVLPKNWQELTATLDKLKAAGIEPIEGGISAGGDLSVWAMSYLFPGVGTTKDATALANNSMKWTDPVVKQTLSAWVSLFDKGYFSEAAKSQDIGAGYTNFLGGKGAFGFLPVAAMKALSDGIGAANAGAIPSIGITSPTANYMPYGAVSVWSVPQYSQKQALAAEYIKDVTSVKVQQDLYDTLAWPPANKTVNLESGVALKVPAISSVLSYFTKADQTQLNVHQLLRIPVATELKRQMQSVINGTSTLDKALAAIQKVQDESVK